MKNLKLLLATFAIVALTSCTPSNIEEDEKKEDTTQMSASDALVKASELYDSMTASYISSFEAEWQSGKLEDLDNSMKFWYDINGIKPENGYPMYISLHGGGGTTANVNDQQWNNQKSLYGTIDGLYWVPRAPQDVWNMWHLEYMENFLLKAVTYAVNKLEVDPNRIYILGYSAGGDGLYNIAPRLADRFAAAAMMAGHPGDARAENLRNLPFAIYVGEYDSSYNRNGLAVKWGNMLDSLQSVDPNGYIHRVVIAKGMGHWMELQDKECFDWLPKFERKYNPNRIIWIQDDVLATRKYNLEVENPSFANEVIVNYDKPNNTINIEKCDYPKLTIWLNDKIMDLDKPVNVVMGTKVLFKGKLERLESCIKESIKGRYDKEYIFCSSVTVEIQ